MGEDVLLEELLVAVERELFAAHGADLPVALHVLLKLRLVVMRREDDFTQRTALLLPTARKREITLNWVKPLYKNTKQKTYNTNCEYDGAGPTGE